METAIEFIIESVMSRGLYTTEMLEEFEQAKEMFEEQIINAHYEGSENYRRQYYNETFKSE